MLASRRCGAALLVLFAGLLIVIPATARPRMAPKKSAPDPDATCEDAKRDYVDDLSANKGAPPDLTADAYGAVLQEGSYLEPCSVPPEMTVTVCAAVREGVAVGVSVSTKPEDEAVASCVAGQVRGLSFPSHPRMDVTTTTFAPPPAEPPKRRESDETKQAEAPPEVPKSGGCNCSIDAQRGGVALAPLPLLLALLVRRRTRR